MKTWLILSVEQRSNRACLLTLPTQPRSRAVQGRININTGGWQAIAAVPLVVPNPNVPAIATGPLARAKTNELAKAIVAYRQANGPFKSIFDLNLVPEFAILDGRRRRSK